MSEKRQSDAQRPGAHSSSRQQVARVLRAGRCRARVMLFLARSYYNLFPKGVDVQVDWCRTAMPAKIYGDLWQLAANLVTSQFSLSAIEVF